MNNWQIQRRTFIAGMGSFSLLQFFHASAQDSEQINDERNQKVSVSFIVPSHDEAKLRALAKRDQLDLPPAKPFTPPREETDTYPDPGFAPLVIIVGAVVVGYVARLSFGLWGEYQYGGLIVDATKSPVEIREHRALARGHILVIKPDGSSENFQPNDETELERILKKALTLKP